MHEDLITTLSQFGPVGLVGMMWLIERRLAAARERQLSEAHRQLMAADRVSASLMDVLRDNTRAIVKLEQTQRQLIELANDLLRERMKRSGTDQTRREGSAAR